MCLAVLLFLVGTWGAANDKQKDEPAQRPGPSFGTGGITHGQPDRGLAAFLISRGDPFNAGGPIALSYGVICIGSQPARADAPQSLNVVRPSLAADPMNRSWFTVSGPDGRDLKYQGEFVNWPRVGPDEVTALWTGGGFIGTTSRDVELNFDFSKPGKYRIRWHYHPEGVEGVWGGGLVSNEIEIEIAP